MIHTTIQGGSLSPEGQRTLFDLLVQTQDWDSLADLCRYRGELDPDVDAALGKLSSVKVTAAWYSRHGRDLEQIRAGLRREKRAGVLVELASARLDDEELYRAVGANSDSVKVQLALAVNGNAPDDVREGAVRSLARHSRSLNRAQSKEFFELLRRRRDLTSAALETATGSKLLAECVLAEHVTDAGRDNLVNQLTVLARSAAATASKGWDRWECARNIESLCELVSTTASADWFDDDLAEAVGDVLDVLDSAWADMRHNSGRTGDPVTKARQSVLARQSETRDDLSSLRTRAEEADEDQALALLDETASMPVDRVLPVVEALLANGRLSVPVQVRVLGRMHFTARERIIAAHGSYSSETVAAMVLQGMLRAPQGEVADLAVAHLDEVDKFARPRIVRAVVSGHLTHEQLLRLPVKELNELAGNPNSADEVAPLVGAALARELDGEPSTVWEQFRTLSGEFPGTLEQLLTVCRATSHS